MRVLQFLRKSFGAKPERVSISYQGDIQIDGKTVEVKSCMERIRVGKHWRTGKPSTRRGMFHFHGHEGNADFILFVLVRSDGKLRLSLHDRSEFSKLGEPFRVPYIQIFGEE